MKNIKLYTLLLGASLAFGSCDNYLDIEPVGKVIASTTSEYRALLTEGYFRYPYSGSVGYFSLLSDEAETLVTDFILGESDTGIWNWRSKPTST